MAAGSDSAAVLAAAAITVGITTDLLDGPVARRAGSVSPFGGTFDHTTDFLFVVSGLAGGVVRGVFPWILPALVAAAFAQYTIDSYWLHRQGGLRGSRLGRYNGVLYFVPLCGDTLARLGLEFVRPAVPVVCWLLVLSTGVSMGQRLMGLRKRPAPPGGSSRRAR